jgi:hypothetical protein
VKEVLDKVVSLEEMKENTHSINTHQNSPKKIVYTKDAMTREETVAINLKMTFIQVME